MRKMVFLLPLFLLFFSSCRQEEKKSPHRVLSVPDTVITNAAISPPSFDLLRNGKKMGPTFSELFRKTSLDSFDLPIIDGRLLKALQYQNELLAMTKPRRNYRIGDLAFDIDQLEETVDILRSRQHTLPVDLFHLLDAHQIWGRDRRGNILFTGYFTPVVEVQEKPGGPYRYPIYDRPRSWSGPLPTRAEIEGEGVLDSLGLEIAFAKSKVDIYYMQVQGSGFVQFPDGRRELLSYNGTNRHPYRSIEKYLLSRHDWDVSSVSINGIKSFLQRNPGLQDSVLFYNPSYTFFKARHAQPKGAGNVPLEGGISVAVDKRYLPLGSCLLAAIPVYNEKAHRVVGHDYRIVLAQDVGGRIKGPGHIDIYFGVGSESRKQAMRMRHYGRLWLLLPKSEEKLFSLN
jgi:membrane-bound lytic murein transglycosylase A